MKQLFRGGRRKVAAVMAIALVASLSQVAPTNAAEKPKAGGTLQVGIFDSFPGYCMADNLANSSLMAGRTIYETWVEQRADGKIVPYVLSSVENSADFKQWKLTVRDGVQFHDGTPVNGDALVTNLQALRGVLTLLGRAPSPGTAGGFTANIVDVIKVSTNTVQVNLFRPQVDFLETLYASGRFFVRAPSQILGGAKCSTTPIGTGPFKLVSTKLNELVVAKNENYWREDKNGTRLPYLDGITFTFLVETASRVSGLKSKSLDMAMFTSAGEVKQIRDLQKNKNVTVIESPEEYYPSIWLNNRIAPFSSKNARLAVSYAIDRVDYNKVRNRNYVSPAKSIVGPNNIMYNEKGYIQYDLKKAKDAVAAYKAETGKDLEFSFPYTAGSTESLANATQIQKYMTAAGIKMNLLPLTTAEIIQRAFPQQFQAMALLLMEGTGTAFIAPFIMSDTSGGNQTHVLRPTPLRVLYGILNLSAFTDTTSDELIWQAKATANPVARKKVYARATELIQSEARLTNIAYQKYALAYRTNVKGVGELGLVNGGQRKLMTNFGIDFTGVWKSGK
ncbi:MAG: ABC transporter substrate-binding protein [Actinobacteria bacterium]|jgi:peptide/nickel transport system substrate-binding protein|nr:ABC transporter substrate-binding protein [Actinomycetota bacterium]NDE20324.1 ABC transporter substrate-binding protein [Actinomycetota bacterium]